MKHIKLIMYMRDNEFFNPNMVMAYEVIRSIDINMECIVFTDHSREFDHTEDFRIVNYVLAGTKYVRLLKMINEEQDDCIYVSIDNDVCVDRERFERYIIECINKDVDFSWARLMSQKEKGFVSKMVSVDKLLSHNVIRPLTWKLGVGLSIPGQCFVLAPKSFQRKLFEIDTFLDDLALGTYISENYNSLNVYVSNAVIGYEFPNTTFRGLCKQRKRWARGFYQVLKASVGKPYFYKVCLHGFFYHGLWVLNWLIFLLCLNTHGILAVVYLLIISGVITARKKRYFLWGIVYQFIFPIFHVVWFFNLLKGDKNNGNG